MPFNDVLNTIMNVLNLIVLIAAVVTLAKTASQNIQAPDKKQDERITALETRVDAIDEKLDSDNKRIKELIDGNEVVQQSLLAIMDYLISPDDSKDTIQSAKKDLQEYLVKRRKGI
jgi:Na+/phosphate symporter